MAALTQDNIKALEQTRQRLLGLHTSLTALQQDLYTQQPLPSWSSLQSHSALVSSNLQDLAQQLSAQQDLLSSLVIHPLPTFPNHQGHIIEQMLRTKLEPDVEDWVEKGQEMTRPTMSSGTLSDRDRDRNELWKWAPEHANLEARRQKWGADYTLAEKEAGVETIITGLNRELVEPPDQGDGEEYDEYDEVTDDEEEEGPDKMDVVGARMRPGAGVQMGVSSKPSAPQMPLTTIHKFMVTGKTG